MDGTCKISLKNPTDESYGNANNYYRTKILARSTRIVMQNQIMACEISKQMANLDCHWYDEVILHNLMIG
jgi:hypothetical protein